MSGLALVALLIALFVVWHFIPEAKSPRPSPKFRRDLRVDARDPRWRDFIEEHCESPAETAFLKAMIDANDFVPELGSLRTDGLKLDLQVQEGGYRVDFLANEWLVIEIDGAAYHSSEEARARDRQRDDYFEGLGYSVLRIPAKVVFTDPDEAVRRVGSALNAGKRKVAAPVQANGFERLGKTMSGLNQAMGEIGDNISRRQKIDAALSRPRLEFAEEKEIIDSVIAGAMTEIKVQTYLGNSEEKRKSFDEFNTKLIDAYERHDQKSKTSTSKESQLFTRVSRFTAPSYCGEAEIDLLIMASYSRMEQERDDYLKDVRQRIRADARMSPLVKSMLAKMDCSEIWVSIC